MHLLDIEKALSAIQSAGFSLNRAKCEFGRATLDFLGFQVGLGRIEHRQRKVEAILNFPSPKSKKNSF